MTIGSALGAITYGFGSNLHKTKLPALFGTFFQANDATKYVWHAAFGEAVDTRRAIGVGTSCSIGSGVHTVHSYS